MPKIILFELNEVPSRILDAYCEAYPQSAFGRMLSLAARAETITEDMVPLSPWITWPTLHRGVTYDHHTIAHLGQPLTEINEAYPALWTLLEGAGAKVGICGSLHSYPMPEEIGNYAFYLPDTFAASPEAFPRALQVFQNFNLQMVRDSERNVSTRVDFKSATELVPYVSQLGLGPSAAVMIAKQLVYERFCVERKVRRRTLQSILTFNAFLFQLQSTKPDFVTFFTNHVASAMHRFWGAKYPTDFEKLGYDHSWIETFGNEIDMAMHESDRMLSHLKAFVDANREYILLVASSMGQAAASGEPIHTQLMLKDPRTFLLKLGVPEGKWRRLPAMHPDYSFDVDMPFADSLENTLGFVTLGRNRAPLNYDRRGNFFHISLGVENPDAELDNVYFGNDTLSFSEAGFVVIETDFKQGCTGYHVPQGILLAYGAQVTRGSIGQVSSCDITPSVLAMMGVSRPHYMRSPVSHLI